MAQHNCGFDHVLHESLNSDSGFQIKYALLSKKFRQLRQTGHKSDEIFTIPVVVHVVYADEHADHNISDEQVKSGIQRLNDIFSDSEQQGIDTKIQFELAKRTPDCQPTDGIVRVDASEITDYATEGIDIESTDTDGLGASRIGIYNLSRWNTEEYLNIWVVNEISGNNAGAGIQAFATFPETHFKYDGVVVLFNAFGYDYDNCNCYELKSYTEENKIIAHEIGHYLGLYHTFQGDSGGYSCPSTNIEEGDKVEDTPAHVRTFSCSNGNNYCYPANDPFYQMEKVVRNYMGYTPESCQYEFTEGQVDRMRTILVNYRPKLLTSSALLPVIEESPSTTCIPQSEQGITGEYGMGIISVNIGNLHAGSGSTFQDGGYVDNWCNVAYFEANTTYEISVETFGNYNEDLKIYIDYDNNSDFDNSEMVFKSNNKSTHEGTFSTPEVVVWDTPLRMRLISDHFQYNINNGCYAPTYGQVEDYTVIFPLHDSEPKIERGNALFLDGVDDYFQTDFSPNPLTDNFTIEFWCKPQGDSSEFQIIFDRTPSDFSTYHFMAMWYGRLFVYMDKELLFMETEPMQMNIWHHVAYTWDGIREKLFVNGIKSGEHEMQNVKENQASLKVGAFLNNFLFFTGQIDEFKTWNYARTEEQIRQQLHLTGISNYEDQVSYFHFNDEITDSTLSDFSGDHLMVLFGNPEIQLSTVNVGPDGTYQQIENISTETSVNSFEVNLEVTNLQADSEFTIFITQQNYEANTYDGLDGVIPFKERTWTINTFTDQAFNTSIKFNFPENTFTDLTASNYKLYWREVSSDTEWKLQQNGASSIDGSSIIFDEINRNGQLLIAK
ncbi:MAG: LamG-like jellyroll fold domain-containing protein [Bacteroidota bacterium]